MSSRERELWEILERTPRWRWLRRRRIRRELECLASEPRSLWR